VNNKQIYLVLLWNMGAYLLHGFAAKLFMKFSKLLVYDRKIACYYWSNNCVDNNSFSIISTNKVMNHEKKRLGVYDVWSNSVVVIIQCLCNNTT